MPTISGLRRRGYTAKSIRDFIQKIGYTKVEGTIDLSLLEHTIREELKETAPRVCAIFNPIKPAITNYEGVDPEVYGGIDNNMYPRPFTVQLGLNLNF